MKKRSQAGRKTGLWCENRALYVAGVVKGWETAMVLRRARGWQGLRDGRRLPMIGGHDAYRRRLQGRGRHDVTRTRRCGVRHQLIRKRVQRRRIRVLFSSAVVQQFASALGSAQNGGQV